MLQNNIIFCTSKNQENAVNGERQLDKESHVCQNRRLHAKEVFSCKQIKI